MALEYDLYVALTPCRILLDPLRDLPGFKVLPKDRAEAPGLGIIACITFGSRRSDLQREYGIFAESFLGFRIDPSACDPKLGYTGNYVLIQAAMAVLKASPADALLLFNGESPLLLLRRQGKLILNKENDWWDNAAKLRLVDLPYEMASLPSL